LRSYVVEQRSERKVGSSVGAAPHDATVVRARQFARGLGGERGFTDAARPRQRNHLIPPRREFFFQSPDDVVPLRVAPRNESEDGSARD
jgi:hypothetical protein